MPFRVITYFFSCLVCLLCLPAWGQTLHFLVFTDTDDPDIGGATLKTHTYLVNDLAPAIAKQAGLALNLSNHFGGHCRVNELDETISQLKAGPDDVIFFYFVGHGWNSRLNDYPSLIFGNANTDRTSLETASRNLLDIYQQLRARNARLTIAIGEACNKERSDEPPLTSGRAVEIMKNTTYNPQRFQRLFRNYRGGFVMSSSKRGQFSHSDPKGGWMSVSWQNAVRQQMADGQTGPATWDKLLKDVVQQTESLARANGDPQNPQIKNDLIDCPTCQKAPPTPTGPPVAPPNGPCPPVNSYVNETALAGIREDLPLLQEMYENIDSKNANAYAAQFLHFYENQKPFYDNLGDVIFYKASQLPEHCRPEFERSSKWVQESTEEITDRYDSVQKYALKPLQLAAQARSELPSLIERLKEILKKLDK